MNDTMFVKPAPGVRVRNPQSRLHISETGAHVPRDQFWMRRLADGDVVEAHEASAWVATIEPETTETDTAEKE